MSVFCLRHSGRLLLLALLLAFGCGPANTTHSVLHIVGGHEGTEAEAKYTVRLDLAYEEIDERGIGHTFDDHCSAVVYKPNLLLTSAHCLQDSTLRAEIYAGVQADVPLPKIISVAVHKDYWVYGQEHKDIALVQLETSIDKERFQPVTLASPSANLPANHMIQVSGYGKEDLNQTTLGPLRTGHMVMSQALAGIGLILVTASAGDSICLGDSGGPAVYRGLLYGLNKGVDDQNPCQSWGYLVDIRPYRSWIDCAEESLMSGREPVATCPVQIVTF